MNPFSGNNSAQDFKIARLVSVLILLGVGSCIVVLLLAGKTLSQIQADRLRTEETQLVLTTAMADLRRERERIAREIKRLGSRQQAPTGLKTCPTVSLDEIIAQCKLRLDDLGTSVPKHVAAFDDHRRSLITLNSVVGEIKIHNRRRNRIEIDRKKSIREARQAIREAVSAIEKSEGLQRLRRSVLVRRFRKAPKEDQEELSVDIINNFAVGRPVVTLKDEFNDFALLVERLIAVQHVDALVSLKDNQLRQTLTRMNREVASVPADESPVFARHIRELQETIFGKDALDDASHQTMLVGQGGLYSQQRRFLRSHREHHRIELKTSACLANCIDTERKIAVAIGDLSSLAATRGEQSLNKAWNSAVATATVVGALFFTLGGGIASLGRRVESQLLVKNDKLKEHVAEIKSSNVALEKSNDKANAATRAKSEFLANMSHEIRTPMTAILGFADILLKNVTDERQLEAAATIRQNGEYLLEIINDILDLSKIEAGKLEVETIECSPCQLLAELSSLMRVRAKAGNLGLHIEYDGPIPRTIQSDPTRLRQILINLVGNAIKFTKTGEVRVVARVVDHQSDQPKMQFEVIDSGIGMTDKQIESLFKPFCQADTSTTRQYGGTGLGLTISKRLAEQLGGDITVKSVSGEGSTFTATVTTGLLDGVELLTTPTEVEISTTKDKATTAGESELDCRVLVAEDGHVNQRLITLLLKDAGAEVSVADNGQLAYDLALEAQREGKPFDVILMDMQMPVMDGYTATAKLRDAKYGGPIIAMTAHAMSTDRAKCLGAGCDDYMSKPFDQAKMISLVAEYATGKKRHRDENALST